jgi:ribonucleoside-diphosphate reductase beta chain
MIEDVKDWKNKLTTEQKQFLTHIFRFFTQGDIDVAGGYVKNYLPYFPQPEVRMMLLGFAAREALHIVPLVKDFTKEALIRIKLDY